MAVVILHVQKYEKKLRRRIERDMIKNIICSSCKASVIFVRLKKNEISRQTFEKYSVIKFNGNPSSGSRVVTYEQTDGHTDLMKLIVCFQNFTKAPRT